MKIYDTMSGLGEMYPNAKCELEYNSVFELLIAVILSAQCTDKRVNIITSELFKEHNTPQKILELGQDGLIEYIKSCGLYKAKSQNIINTCKILVEKYNGNVPNTMDELITLPGVGRKTASVVLAVGFGIPAFPVDTHVFRVSNRIGIANADNVEETERQIEEQLKPEDWITMHHYLIFHGRNTCNARNPKCNKCKIKDKCLYFLHKIREIC